MHFLLEIKKNEQFFSIVFTLVPKCFNIMHGLQIPGTLFSVKSQNWSLFELIFTITCSLNNDKFCHFLDWQNFHIEQQIYGIKDLVIIKKFLNKASLFLIQQFLITKFDCTSQSMYDLQPISIFLYCELQPRIFYHST